MPSFSPCKQKLHSRCGPHQAPSGSHIFEDGWGWHPQFQQWDSGLGRPQRLWKQRRRMTGGLTPRLNSGGGWHWRFAIYCVTMIPFLLPGWGGSEPLGVSLTVASSFQPRPTPGGLRDPAGPPPRHLGAAPPRVALNSCFGGRRWLFLEFSCFYYFLSLSWSALTRS